MAQATELALSVRPSGTSRAGRTRLGLPVLLTLPTLVVVFVVFGIPLVYSLVLSLHRINMLTQQWMFVGLQNYLDILPNPDFLAALGRTAYFAVVTVGVGLIWASRWRSCSTRDSPAAISCAASCSCPGRCRRSRSACSGAGC